MKKSVTAFLCALVLAASHCSARAENHITFAIPESGFVTLGIFDSAGRLVRALHTLAPTDDFRKGLNGLITEWDGYNDSGGILPSGHYHIRGYLIPEIEVEGVAYHFNDWLSETNAPALAWIEDFAVLPGDVLVISGKTPQGTLFCARHEAGKGFLWSAQIEGVPPVQIAILDRTALLKTSSSWHALALSSGTPSGDEVPPYDPVSVDALTSSGNTAIFAIGNHLEAFPLMDPPLPKPPCTFSSLAASGSTIFGAAEEGVFISQDSSPFQKIPLPIRVTSLSTNDNHTFWFTGAPMSADPAPIVAQSDATGEILRLLSSEPAAPLPVLVRALPDFAGFVVLEQSHASQRMRLIRLAEDKGWTTLWERVIQKAPAFGFFNGNIVEDAPLSANKLLRVRLKENPLTGENGEIALSATYGPQGTFLMTEDGLPVVCVSNRTDITRVLMDYSLASSTLRLIQGNGAGAEEFLIHNLGSIIPLNVGGIELP